MQKFLQRLERFSQSLLSPLSYLSAAGLLLVLGALLTSKPLCQALPVLQWAPLQLMGQLLYNGMMVLINNLSVILCVGVAAVRAKTEKQDAALLALMAYLVFLTANHTALEALGLLAQPNGMTGLAGTGQTTILGIQVVDTGVASGIVLGFAAAWLFNRTCEKQFYGMITQLYSGLRWSFLCLSALAVALGLGFCFVCPPLQRAVSALTGWIAASGNAGVFLYGFLERLLIPTGLHHLIYMPFQFSSLGGSLTVGFCDLHRCLRRLHDRVHHGPAPLGRHRLDVHRLHQDLWLSGHCGGLHLHGPQGEPCPYRRRYDPAGGHGLGGLHHRAH